MLKKVEFEDYADAFSDNGPEQFAESNGTRFFFKSLSNGCVNVFAEGDGNYYLGDFTPDQFEQFQADVRELYPEEVLMEHTLLPDGQTPDEFLAAAAN